MNFFFFYVCSFVERDMSEIATYEGSLRSYIQARIQLLESALEEEIRNHDHVDISLLEQQFDRESDNFISNVTRRIEQIRDEIKSHRPTNFQDPNYETRLIQYRQFLQSSSISINRMTDWVNSLFEQVTSTIKRILQWMIDNAATIVDILEQIRDAFHFLATFFTRN